jgi:hypothetical protein
LTGQGRESREPHPGELVRLTQGAAGLSAGAMGVLIGFYAREAREAVVRFYDGGPLRVPADAIEPVPAPVE